MNKIYSAGFFLTSFYGKLWQAMVPKLNQEILATESLTRWLNIRWHKWYIYKTYWHKCTFEYNTNCNIIVRRIEACKWANVIRVVHLYKSFLKRFLVIYGSVRHHFHKTEQTCGVTGVQLWILQEIAKTNIIGISELATRMSRHQSICSQLVEKLIGFGMVIKVRIKEDQRRFGLCLTIK